MFQSKYKTESGMGASFLPCVIFTALWGVVGIILPFMVPRSPHKSVIRVQQSEHHQSSWHKHCLSLGYTDVDSRLLLAVLALLLHESDEPSHWTSSRDQSLVCDEEGVGWFRGVETDVKKEPAFLSLIFIHHHCRNVRAWMLLFIFYCLNCTHYGSDEWSKTSKFPSL